MVPHHPPGTLASSVYFVENIRVWQECLRRDGEPTISTSPVLVLTQLLSQFILCKAPKLKQLHYYLFWCCKNVVFTCEKKKSHPYTKNRATIAKIDNDSDNVHEKLELWRRRQSPCGLNYLHLSCLQGIHPDCKQPKRKRCLRWGPRFPQCYLLCMALKRVVVDLLFLSYFSFGLP